MKTLCWITIWAVFAYSSLDTWAFSPYSAKQATGRHFYHTLLHAKTHGQKGDEKKLDRGPIYLRFSNNFQRHLVYEGDKLVESFEFLDDAIESYPTCQFKNGGIQTFDNELPDLGIVAGGGKDEQTAYRRVISGVELQERTQNGYGALLTLSHLVTGSESVSIVNYLADRVGKLRFLMHTNTTISSNYINLLHLLNQIGFTPVVAKQSVVPNFPQICLYDSKEIAERLRFLMAPMPPKEYIASSKIDWPLLAVQGFGVGLTKDQVNQVLKGIPHILAMHYEDAAQKPNFLYFYQALRVPKELMDETRDILWDYLDGATPSDVSMVAYVKSRGASWSQLRILLQAFPSLVTCDTDPAWVMYHRTATRFVFKEHVLHYLCARLQVSPSEVQAMIKTYSSLVDYNVPNNIIPTLNALQNELRLSSQDTRKILLRMPSLVGMSVETGLMPRLEFFIKELGFSREQFSQMILIQPSIFQSSIENSLRPKILFFLNDMRVPMESLRGVLKTAPRLLALSLHEKLRPTSQAFLDYCEISWEQMGHIIVKNPDLLTLSWKRNLLPTLKFLQDRLRLSSLQLRELVYSAPRILKFSVETSLGPKIDLIENVLGPNGDVTQILLANPSLLLTTTAILERRLSLGLASEWPLENALMRRRQNTNNKVVRHVLEICVDTNEESARYPSSKQAAIALDISLQKVYGLCRSGKVFNGKRYSYLESKAPTVSSIPKASTTARTIQGRSTTVARNEEFSTSLAEALRQSANPLERGYDRNVVPLVVYVAGRIYPTDGFEQARGERRSGGMSLLFPQVAHGSEELVERLRRATIKSFTQIMPEEEGGTSYDQGTILNGYPYLRPSRNRCELYACHEALKVIVQLLKQDAALNSNFTDMNVQVDIYTDSDYVWKLLANQTRIIEWGSHSSEEAVVYKGPGQKSWANLDLLYPLSRTYTLLVARNGVASDADSQTPGTKIDIRFLHSTADGTAEYSSQLPQKAKDAATWHYQSFTVVNASSTPFK